MNNAGRHAFQFLFGSSARAEDMPNRDASPQEPVIFPHEPRDFNVICIDLKTRCLYPFGTQTSNEPFFWSRTGPDGFNSSYLYIRDLYEMNNGTLDPPQTQAEWWYVRGKRLVEQLCAGALNEPPPPIPAPPIITDSESVVCYHLVEKTLWHMPSPTEVNDFLNPRNPKDRRRIRDFLGELLDAWENDIEIPTPQDMMDHEDDDDDSQDE